MKISKDAVQPVHPVTKVNKDKKKTTQERVDDVKHAQSFQELLDEKLRDK